MKHSFEMVVSFSGSVFCTNSRTHYYIGNESEPETNRFGEIKLKGVIWKDGRFHTSDYFVSSDFHKALVLFYKANTINASEVCSAISRIADNLESTDKAINLYESTIEHLLKHIEDNPEALRSVAQSVIESIEFENADLNDIAFSDIGDEIEVIKVLADYTS